MQAPSVVVGSNWPALARLDRPSPWLTRAVLASCDLLSALAALLAAGFLWEAIQPAADLGYNLHFWPLVAILPVSFAFLGLYPAAGVSVVQEFRRSSLFITAMFATVVAVLFLTGDLAAASRGFFALAWPFTVAAVPLARVASDHLPVKARIDLAAVAAQGATEQATIAA